MSLGIQMASTAATPRVPEDAQLVAAGPGANGRASRVRPVLLVDGQAAEARGQTTSSPTRSPRQSRPKHQLSPWLARLLPFCVPVLGLLVWTTLSRTGLLSTRILPDPLTVVVTAWQLLRSGELVHHVAVSSVRAGIGFLIGGSVGFALGLLNGTSRWAEATLDTPIQMIRTVPHLALLPLVILWFGLGEEAKIFLVAVGVMFPLYINTFHGARTVDRGLLEMGRIYGLSRWQRFSHIVLPAALPSILVGVRFALGVMWLSLIVAETIAADAGIGYLAMTAREFMRTDVVVMSLVLYAALGKLADLAARLLERWWLPWHAGLVRTR
jgi:sulfonate transport system permease protein